MNPVILADNRFLDGTPTATDTAAGYDVLYLRDLKTFTAWRAASAGTKYITVDCGVNMAADTVAIAAHNLGSAAGAVSVESSVDGSDWTPRMAPVVATADKTAMWAFASAAARFWRVKIVTASVAPTIGELMLGRRITFPCPPDAPFIPAQESIEAEVSTSKTGQLLGTTVRFRSVSIVATWRHLPRGWVDQTFEPFRANWAAALAPFFWAWDLDVYPADVRFVRLDARKDHAPSVELLGYYAQLSLAMEGIAE